MALHWPTFFTRLGSAIVFSAIMLTGLLWHDWAFAVLALLIQVLCLRDYFRLIEKIGPEAQRPAWLPIAVQVLCAPLPFLLLAETGDWVDAAVGVLMIVPAVLLLCGTLAKKTALHAAMQGLTAILYIALPIFLFTALRQVSFALPIAVVLMIWMNDTMAYLVGSFIGRTPFSPISPKKTWEGTAGGAVLNIVGAGIWGYYAQVANFTMPDWMIIAAIVSVAGTAGDLLESKLKRLANVKDSGTMMPGHGGALDRFDSLLVALPFVFAYIWLFVDILE